MFSFMNANEKVKSNYPTTTEFKMIDLGKVRSSAEFEQSGEKFQVVMDDSSPSETVYSLHNGFNKMEMKSAKGSIKIDGTIVNKTGVDIAPNKVYNAIGLRKMDNSKCLVFMGRKSWIFIQGHSEGVHAFQIHLNKNKDPELLKAAFKVLRFSKLRRKSVLKLSRIEMLALMNQEVPLTKLERERVDEVGEEFFMDLHSMVKEDSKDFEEALEMFSRDTDYSKPGSGLLTILFFLVLFINKSNAMIFCGNETFGESIDHGPCPEDHHEMIVYHHEGMLISDFWLTQQEVAKSNKTEVKCTSKSGKLSQHCQEKCVMNGHACTGSKDYCKDNKCKQRDSCFCKKICVNEKLKGKALGKWVDVEEAVRRFYFKTEEKGLKKRSVMDEPVSIFIDIQENRIKVDLNMDGNYTAVLRKKDYHEMKNVTKEFYFHVPLVHMRYSSAASIRVFKDSELVGERHFHLMGFRECKMPDCFYCWEIVSSHTCLHNRQKLAMVLILLYQISGLLSLISTIIVICVALKACIKKPFTVVVNIRDEVKQSRAYNWIKKMSQEKEKNDRDLESNNGGSSLRVGKNTTVMFIILLMLPLALSCGDSFSITSDSVSCESVGNGEEECTFSIDTLGFLNAPGTTACYTVVDEDDSVLATIEVSYTRKFRVLQLRDLYYTSDWKGESETLASCFGTDYCGHSQSCEDEHINSIEKKTPVEEFYGYHQTWPGISDCFRSPGCATNGCFSCVPQCVYSIYSIIPEGEVCKVSAYEGMLTSLLMHGKVTTETDEESGAFFVGAQTTVGAGEVAVSFEIQGSFEGPAPDFNDRKHMVCGQAQYLTDASDRNSPQKSTIGDVQAESSETMTSGSFIYDLDMATKSEVGTSAVYSFTGSGMKSVEKNAYPLTAAGFDWMPQEGGAPYAFDETATTVSYSMRTVGAAKIKRKVKAVCPTFELEESEGCYSCDDGFVVKIKAKSICEEGTAIVRSGSPLVKVNTQVVNLTLSDEFFDIKMSSDSEDNDFELCLHAGKRSSCNNVIVSLEEDITVRNETQTRNNTVHESLGFSILESLGGDFNWFYEILIWLGMIGALAFVLWFLISCLPRMVMKSKMDHKKMK